MIAEKIVLNEKRNVTLTAYIQSAGGEFGFSKRPAMIVIPGGGYAMCSDLEADPVAMAYSKAGFQTFVLRYTVKEKGNWPYPLEDYEQAIELIQKNAENWYIDPEKIAVVGFSAGGHLAACAATIAKHKPAAAVLVYPAILRDICDMCQPGLPCPNEHVTMDTCPCFVVAARDDRTVNIKNSLMMELALAENGVPFESHIYSYGGHGFSTAENWITMNSMSERLPDWVPNSIGWLKEIMGELTGKGFTEPNASVKMNEDNAPVLSVMCTLGHIMKQNEKVQEVVKPMHDVITSIAEERKIPVPVFYAAIEANTIREIMETLLVPADVVKKINEELHEIKNEF